MRHIVSPSPYARSVGEGFDRRIIDPYPSYSLMSVLPTNRRVAVFQGIVRSLHPRKRLPASDIHDIVIDRSLALYHSVGLVGNATLALIGSLENQEEIVTRHTQGVFTVDSFEVQPALGYLIGAGIINSVAPPGGNSPHLYEIAGDYMGGLFSDATDIGSITNPSFRIA